MTKEKYCELRRRRFKDRGKRFTREKTRVWEQNEALRRRVHLPQTCKASKKQLLVKEEEDVYRRKSKELLESIQDTVETIKETKKISEYVPKLTSSIDDLLSRAESYYRSTDYVKVLDISPELQELLAKAEAEALKIIEEQKKRRRETRKYFYAVISPSEEKSFGNIGMNDGEVYTIPYRDIAAVVSDTSLMEYELIEENVRKHDAVLRRVMDEYTLVPAEFGTVTNNERILKRLLRKAYKPTRECLKLVDNMVELGMKAVVEKDMAYFDNERGKKISAEILESLKKRADQSVSGELFSGRLILNESFLVKKEEVDAFSKEVAQLEEIYPILKFLYSGPWAPYNFVYIKIGKEGIEFSKMR